MEQPVPRQLCILLSLTLGECPASARALLPHCGLSALASALASGPAALATVSALSALLSAFPASAATPLSSFYYPSFLRLSFSIYSSFLFFLFLFLSLLLLLFFCLGGSCFLCFPSPFAFPSFSSDNFFSSCGFGLSFYFWDLGSFHFCSFSCCFYSGDFSFSLLLPPSSSVSFSASFISAFTSSAS